MLMSHVGILVVLMIVMPATNAVSERSFSATRRIKSYLRTTMSQQRLNHLMLLHVHKSSTDQLSLVDVANDFIAGSDHRKQVFGMKFLPSDLQTCASFVQSPCFELDQLLLASGLAYPRELLVYQ